MDTTLALRFPWGRYHATPWDRSANDASIEWPPSPWRIVRALYATWRGRASHLPEASVVRVLDTLSRPPEYWTPIIGYGHTRHYMPDTTHRAGVAGGTDLVVDSFALLPPQDDLIVRWETPLDDSDRDTLQALAAGLSYLGRAESLCDVRLADRIGELPADGWVRPTERDGGGLRLLAPRRPLHLPGLTTTTSAARAGGYVVPPTAYWVPYMPAGYGALPAEKPVRTRPRRPEAARFAVVGGGRPSLYAATAVAETLRHACLSRRGDRSAVLAGKDNTGTPIQDDHAHAHYLVLDLDGDGIVDQVAVWAPGGLPAADVTALALLDEIRPAGFVSDFRAFRVGLEAVGPTTVTLPELARPARRWRSHTPFLPARHRKRQPLTEFITAELARELRYRGIASPANVRLLDRAWGQFRRHRLPEHPRQRRWGVGVEMEFPIPIQGPLALGGLSHFGMGLMLPVD